MKFTISINEDGTRRMAVVFVDNDRRFAEKIPDVNREQPMKEQLSELESNAQIAVDKVLAARGRRSVQGRAT